MPELPEAETITRHLRRELQGKHFSKVLHCRRDVIRHGSYRSLQRMLNASITDVDRRGKRPFLEIEGGSGIVFFLGMTGRLSICDTAIPVEKHTHLRIRLGDGQRELRFNDARRFGGFGFFKRENGCEPVGIDGLGPEPTDVTPAQFRKICERNRQIKALLLDQKYIAGLGNIYADESLFRAGIHPLTSAADLDAKQVGRLLRAIKRVLSEAIEYEGTTIINYLHPDGPGNFQSRLRVYGHEGENCRTCKVPIQRMQAAGRSSFVCPMCQPPVA
ncbi:MAG: formamidopyrimidine-DNA glycosylase [Phycisphaerae bacterium]|nr:MAG: formamidopyrimidine-DNA glycosylase [Phycisphaerae bacterium]